MSEERITFAEEFPEEINGENATPDIDLPTGAAVPAVTERATFTLNDGSQGSRAAFIREKFLQDNMSRKEISEKFDFPYRVVYSATVNMTNTAEAPQRGRSATSTVINVTADNKAVITRDDGTYVNGEKVDDIASLGELHEVNRNEWIKEQVDQGVSRGNIAKYLDMSYGVIYNITKEHEGTRQRIEITDENGNAMSRAEYIRKQYAAGKSRGDIAKELDVPYNIVWQATKTTKSTADQFKELVESIKSYKDKVTDADLFQQVCDALDTITIAEEEEEKATEKAPTDEAPASF